ncbi:HNH endonuclease [Streptomyces sp. NPDC092359]|uniref:HNH endonuclease n=1 Tax=Streptomyces sp. NPDC092359 TaxID=3366014 RepID=UPI00381EAC8E
MPANRPAIPSKLDRRVRLEAGHRCAIPVCRVPVIEIAHIHPWAKLKRHDFENLIALCPTCHTLFDRGHIDRLAMLQYKANLSPFSPYALAAYPYHADFLAAYQKFRAFIEMWLTGALAFQGARQRGARKSELQRTFKEIGDVAMEASYARHCFATESSGKVIRLSDEIFYVTVRRTCKLLGKPVPTVFPENGASFAALPAMWADLHHEIHKVLNRPAPKVVKVMPTRPMLVNEVIRPN